EHTGFAEIPGTFRGVRNQKRNSSAAEPSKNHGGFWRRFAHVRMDVKIRRQMALTRKPMNRNLLTHLNSQLLLGALALSVFAPQALCAGDFDWPQWQGPD